MITVQVEIKEVVSGEVATCFEEYEDDLLALYQWEEGNYSCDCNRILFFARALGFPDIFDAPCGDEKYKVRLTDVNGEVLYSEF